MLPSRCRGCRDPGTRFRLYPQPSFLTPGRAPETVVVSAPAGSVGPGPADDRMYAIYPLGKTRPYGLVPGWRGGPLLYLPPWDGMIRPPPQPDPDGHFDHLPTDTPEFELAHLYASVRFVLDVWEGYFGRRLRWHFADDFPRMQLSILPSLDNALTGYGFLEVGGHLTEAGHYRPFSLNFDVIAHEVGHTLIYGEVGLPDPEATAGEYYGFHESAADLVAMVSALHFELVLDDLLDNTSGNLYRYNRLNRIGELSRHTQIRMAANSDTLGMFSAGWRDEHKLAQPLTGAIFDVLVDVYHELLLDRGLIDPEVEALSDRLEGSLDYDTIMQPLFDQAYARNAGGFREALIATRDWLGCCLAAAWSALDPDWLDYAEVGDLLIESDRDASGGRFASIIRGNFAWREIGTAVVGPRLAAPDRRSHAHSARTLTPAVQLPGRSGPYLERLRRSVA